MEKSCKSLKQFLITPAAGKRLIARSLAVLPEIADSLVNRTVVIIAGTTNGYVAEEILKGIRQEQDFSRGRFFRGVSLPSGFAINRQGRLDDGKRFPGDVVIRKGVWEKGKTIDDVVDDLQAGDIVIKGANAVELQNRQAAVLIGGPKGGTILLAMQAVVGRRVALYLPVGLEKRVCGDLNSIARKINDSHAQGCRYYVVGGRIITELEAVDILSGAKAELIAAGGVCGAEGSCWIAVSGTADQVSMAETLISSVSGEPAFEMG